MISSKTKRKFCFISPSFFFERSGGTEIQNWYISLELIKRGWEVHYIREITARKQGKTSINGIIMHSIPRLRKRLRWINTWKTGRIMKSVRADIWYCRGSSSYLFPTVFGAKLFGGRVVWHFTSEEQFIKDLTLFRNVKPIWLPLTLLDTYAFWYALKHADMRIVQTHQQKKVAQINFGLQGEVIYNAHPIPSLDNKDRKPMILWIGSIKEIKRPELFPELARRMKNSHHKFIMIGRPVNKLLTQTLRAANREMTNFKYVGELYIHKIHAFLSEARILVCTSSSEGFSNTFVEAWMHGVPVLSLTVDPDGIIRRSRLGCVSQTLENMVLDINRLMDNHNEWRLLSKRCKSFAHKNLSIISAVDRLEELTTSENV